MTEFKMNYYMLEQATDTERMNMMTYGIRLVQTYPDGKVLSLDIPAISAQKNKIEHLLEMMRKGYVTIMTAEEIVEDFLEI